MQRLARWARTLAGLACLLPAVACAAAGARARAPVTVAALVWAPDWAEEMPA